MSPPYSNSEGSQDLDETLTLYGDSDCNGRYAETIQQVLSKHLNRRVTTKVEVFDRAKGRWIYSARMSEGGMIHPIKVSENVRIYLRRLVTNAYANRQDLIPFDRKLRNGGSEIIEKQFLDRGGMIAYMFYTDMPTFNDDPDLQRAIAHYWIVRGWADAAVVIDNTVRPPILNPDNTIIIYIRDVKHVHYFIRTINDSLRKNRRTEVEYSYLNEIEDVITFRAQEGFPLIIGDIGVKLPSTSRISRSRVKREYLAWLQPCIGDEDLSWEEFGRIIKDNGDCYALEETPENTLHITFMRIARELSIAGVYPLGPFPGLLLWPHRTPDIINDFKIMGYSEAEVQALEL